MKRDQLRDVMLILDEQNTTLTHPGHPILRTIAVLSIDILRVDRKFHGNITRRGPTDADLRRRPAVVDVSRSARSEPG